MDEQAKPLKAFLVDDYGTIFAAEAAGQAADLYAEECGEPCDSDSYPRELTDAELDMEHQAFDEDERPIKGRTGTVRSWLADAKPGYLCGGES